MIHVDDLVQALIMVSKEERAKNEIFIVTDGNPYSSREIYETMCNILNKSIPFWSVPSWLLNFMSKFNKTLQYKIDKLIGDEWYSSEKIESIGFEAKISINKLDENEAFF
jgi:UDP-glucose 4-epimerase